MQYDVGLATNLALDDRPLEEAVRIGGKATKKAAGTEALEEYSRAASRPVSPICPAPSTA